MSIQLKGSIITPQEIVQGTLAISDGVIDSISTTDGAATNVFDFSGHWILPGFIDPHVHGLGHHTVSDTSGILGMAVLQPRYGTTAFLPTATAMTRQEYINFGLAAREISMSRPERAAKIPGVHLEGPFINPRASGAMALSTRRPVNIDEVRDYIHHLGSFLKLMTLSPELENSHSLIRHLVDNGSIVSMGHTVAEPEHVAAFVKTGVSYVTHLYNAIPLSGAAEPGVPKAGLICDLIHVPVQLIQSGARVLGRERFIAITDSLCGAGLEQGSFSFADGSVYHMVDGVARLTADESLAGSTLTMNKAFHNLVSRCRISPLLAARYTSANAARVLGLDDTGELVAGKRADITVLDKDGGCLATFIDGNLAYQNSGSSNEPA